MSLLNTFRTAGLAGVVALAATAAQADAVKPGSPAPDFSAATETGKTVKLSDFRGKYVVLEWANEGCPFVKKHYGSGNMQSLQKEYTAKDVVWLTVFSSAEGKQGHEDAAGALAQKAAWHSSPTAMLLDDQGVVGKEFGAKTTPHMFVIDPKGTLIYMGGIDNVASADPDDIKTAKNYVKAALDESMAGKAVTTASAPSYGCSIKYGT
jgi:peroxiredoxin